VLRLLSSLMVMPFVHRATARFFEVDRAGILFFGRVFEMCHAAYEELLLAGDCGIERLIAEAGVGLPLVHSEADFVKPIRLHDRIDVAVSLEKFGSRSLVFAYTLHGAGDPADVRARCKLVHVCVRLADMTPAAPPTMLVLGLKQAGILERVDE